ncbi:serine hydrolase domain-containing protein, partial [Streptomyces griseus]|uniref:serine hydrolase domain-containing protein n=1 Tax=Streptomyces griseus TaxID=1911 RepID=UPI0027DFC9A7
MARPVAVDVRGTVAPGYEPVAEAFVRNFEQRGERGAAVAVYRHGHKVVDLWAGTRDVDGTEPWAVDTVQVVRSAGKGIAAAVPLLLHQRGQVDLDAPVSTYWPEFKTNGKERVLVRDLLAHRAGVAALDTALT